MPCITCGEDKKIKAHGMCHQCYHNEWNRKNRDKHAATVRRWREKQPEKQKAIMKKYYDKHPERSLKNNPELQEKCARARLNAIYRKHDEDLKDDPERLDIRAIITGEIDYFQFRAT